VHPLPLGSPKVSLSPFSAIIRSNKSLTALWSTRTPLREGHGRPDQGAAEGANHLLPPLPLFSIRYWYTCRVKSMWELRWSSSSQSCWLPLREAMAASRKKAAFSAVGARSSLWFCSWKTQCRAEALACPWGLGASWLSILHSELTCLS
jgi:hypothetical protein